MTTKPDRFERLVRKGFKCTLPANQEWIYVTDAIDLLRKEHKAVVRIIKDYTKQCVPPGNERCIEVWEAVPIVEKTCQDILSKLNERAK